MAAEVLNSYVGRYRLDAPEDDNTIVTMTTASGKLFAEVEGQGKMELLAVSDNEFAVILPNQTIKVNFEKDSNDEVEKMRIDVQG